MTCEQALELLSGHLDQTNTEEETTRLMQHLSHCSACRNLLAAFEEVDAGLRELEAEPPADLCDSVLDQIRREQKAASAKKRRPWLGLAAAAAVVLVIGIGSYQLPAVQEEQPSSAAYRSRSVELETSAYDIDVPVTNWDRAVFGSPQEMAEYLGAEIIVAHAMLPEIQNCGHEVLEDGSLLYILESRDAAAQMRAAYELELYAPVKGAVSDVSYVLLIVEE